MSQRSPGSGARQGRRPGGAGLRRIGKRLAVALLVLLMLLAGSAAFVLAKAIRCEAGEPRVEASAPAHPEAAPEVERSASPLERFAPYLRLDSGDVPPAAVEALVEAPDAELRRGGSHGELIASVAGEPERLSLGFLGAERYANGEPVGPEDVIDAASAESAPPGDGDGVIYGREATGSDGHRYLQYWLFWPFNDSLPGLSDTWLGWLGGFGDHRGDWELIQIRLRPNGEPDLVTFSQHRGVQSVPWSEVDEVDGHPVGHAGCDTHALKSTSGCQLVLDEYPNRGAIPDCSDGRGPLVKPAVRSFGAWADWPGGYGTIAAPCTRDAWDDPAVLVNG